MIYVNRLRLYIIALVLLTIGGTNRIFAQQDSTQTSQPRSMVKLTGRIVDEDHEPVSFCNVRVVWAYWPTWMVSIASSFSRLTQSPWSTL